MSTLDYIFIVGCCIALVAGAYAAAKVDAAMRRGEQMHRRRK